MFVQVMNYISSPDYGLQGIPQKFLDLFKKKKNEKKNASYKDEIMSATIN